MTAPNQFESFWLAFPLKVKKLAARKAWQKAAVVADFDKIMAGLTAYKKFKPVSQDWCHAATWLNGERWDDVWKAEPIAPKFNPPSELAVLTYCRDKGGTDKDWDFARSWHRRWASKGWRQNGVLIDWKIVFSEEFSKQRSN